MALILAAVLFIAVFSYLAARFDYPDVLDRPAADVLPRLIALGHAGRAVWLLYALIPLLLVPAGVGVWVALRGVASGAARSAAAFATIAGFSMMLGLARWPTIQWELGQAYASATPAERPALAALFTGLNSYLGNFIGEFVGELALNLFFLLTSYALMRTRRRSKIGFAGVIVSVLGFGAMFRNVTPLVALAAEVNNFVLPIWLVVLGIVLAREPGVTPAP